ncbi:hypothetical protein SteCoe_9434 [Stentor coeruleus]|uniref:Uncharacterized protein n=1 Tax=Stentor coeruleus TaxID=5963 RepID=A0A1R2CHV1_9CILI|nr:hypothetical protein SteCoe_9434 [Stentor coeruleus]
MNKRPANFSFHDKQYKVEYSWSLTLNQRPLGRPYFSNSKQENDQSFIISKHFGFMVCENYQASNVLSELQTEKMQVTSMDYCTSREQLAAITFSTGHILLINPTLRKRGKIVWLNSRKNIYSSKPPSVCRWVNENQFIVFFGDNFVWKFDKTLTGEDEKFIQAAQNNTRECQKTIVCINHPAPEANPISLWKLQIGKVRDVQVAPGSRGNIICVLSEFDIKIIDLASSTVIITLGAYFAGFQCVTWSEDAKLLVAGGEDDCIHVWHTTNWNHVCKGQAHSSWVAGVLCKYKQGVYIVSSVGQDGKLCFWEIPEDDIDEGVVATGPLVEYPKKSMQKIIETSIEVKVSEEPLISVSLHNDCIFVCDVIGTVHMWV